MSSPYEDKPGADDTAPSTGGVTTTTAPAPALVSISGPVAPAGEGTWCDGRGLHVRYAGRTAVGLVREHNEDNFVIANLTSGEVSEREAVLTDIVGAGGLLFAVCDGMGGAAAGEVASQMAVDVLLEAMRRGGAPAERDALARRLVSAVEEAGRRIFDAAQKERSRRGMGTTATAAVLIDKVLFLAEVGDSRAYLLRAGQLKQLTKDQSLVNQLIEAGHLTEAEAEAFEHSNIILQALGTSETVQVDLTFVELRRGDRLMLCSDGLSGLVHGDTLRDTLAGIDDPAECTAALVRFAEAGGGHDNITVVVIDFDGDALEVPRETDSFGYLQYPLVPAASAASTFSEEEVTEATKPLSMGNYESAPSYHPPAGPGVDTSPWLWVSAGLAALLVGTWLLAVGGSVGSAVSSLEDVPTDGSNVTPAETPEAPAAAAEPTTTAAAEAKGVPVHVHSDVEDAVLLVNGESHGPLATGQGQALELPPGAYRFEAQRHGNTAAVEVVNVPPDPDAPRLDVFLRLPAGANGPAKAEQPTPPKPAEAPSQAAQAPAPDAPAAAAQPAAESPTKAPLAEPTKLEGPAVEPKATPAPAPGTPGPLSAPGGHAAPAAPARKKEPPRAPAAAAPKAAPAPTKTAPPPTTDKPEAAPAVPEKPAASAPTPAPTPTPAEPKPDSPIPDNPF